MLLKEGRTVPPGDIQVSDSSFSYLGIVLLIKCESVLLNDRVFQGSSIDKMNLEIV